LKCAGRVGWHSCSGNSIGTASGKAAFYRQITRNFEDETDVKASSQRFVVRAGEAIVDLYLVIRIDDTNPTKLQGSESILFNVLTTNVVPRQAATTRVYLSNIPNRGAGCGLADMPR
jgi:hypothetical protein